LLGISAHGFADTARSEQWKYELVATQTHLFWLSAPASHAPESHVGRHSMSQIRDQQYGKRTITPMRIAAAMTNE